MFQNVYQTALNLPDRVSISITTVIAAIIGYGFTKDWGDTLLAGAIGAALVAIPKIIDSLTNSRKTYAGTLQAEFAAILKSQNDRIATLQSELTDERNIVRLSRISKHNIAGAAHLYSLTLIDIQLHCRKNDIRFPFEFPRIIPEGELTKEEDEGMTKIVKKSIENGGKNESNR